MDRRLIVLVLALAAVMAFGAAAVVMDRPDAHLLPLAGQLGAGQVGAGQVGAGRRPLPVLALFAAPAGLVLNLLFVALRQPTGDDPDAIARRRWSATFLAGVAILFGALEALEIGALYGWFPAGEHLPRLLLTAAALWLAFAANGAAKLAVLGRTDASRSPRRLALNRFGALIGFVIGVLLIPVSLLAPLANVVSLWLIVPLALALLVAGRAAILAMDARSVG